MGSGVSTINDGSMQIQIGGNEEDGRRRQRQKMNRIKTTKYSYFTFLPLNLLEQFRRIANIYFLVMTICSWLIDSPVSPMTALVPLIFVIAVTAAKQGYEDIKRHKSDNKVNCAPVTIIRNGEEKQIESQYLSPGDLVLVKRDCDVPCDLVLIHSSDPHGKCFITTVNLDGESNLKTLLVPKGLPNVDFNKMPQLGVIQCERPTTDLYSFNGKIELSEREQKVLPLSTENVLLRGSRVKNTEYVIGCAVYTGMTTKLQLNSRLTRNKFASSEKYLNRFLIFILVLMVVVVTVLYLLKRKDELFLVPQFEYLGPPIDVNSITEFLQDYLSFLVLFKYLIPISMYVTIELQRAMAGLFMKWDIELYDESTDQPCMVNTTNLNEELGQINILFSDKTGTLTKNEMIFLQCSIAGKKYLYKKTKLQEEVTSNEVDFNRFDEDQRSFFQALAICHTVQVAGDMKSVYDGQGTESQTKTAEKNQNNCGQQNDFNSLDQSLISDTKTHKSSSESRSSTNLVRAESQRRKGQIEEAVKSLDYQSSSADERALVEACAHLGLIYIGDDDEILKIRIVPPHMDYSQPCIGEKLNDLHFERLHVLEFTSDRKRMSVIIKDENGIKWIYTKGAESCVFPLCCKQSADMISKTDAHITEFARLGLRTLAVARRRLTNEEYQQFVNELNEIKMSLENRKELSEKCYAKVENNLDLLGATAVEDALQDDVADTLQALQKAGIKTWVLTGDKMETALNIAISCGHITQNAFKYFINDCIHKDGMLDHLNSIEQEVSAGEIRDFALLIDGTSLEVALRDTPNEFRDVALKCTAVLCCRLSPLQKSKVVYLIKTSRDNFITAAIGDGANDVSMIQEAHVGIGIIGKEGSQAAQCADFAFAKFSMLKRMLLVHGHYHTIRLSLLLLYFFYKDVFLMTIMFIFQFHTLFSTTSAFDSLPMTLYNVIYTTLPILVLSLTEKPYPEETLMRVPELYKKNTHNKQLQWPSFMSWNLYGVYHAVICFYFTSFIFATNDVILNVGQTADFACYCALLLHIVVIIVNLKLWLETKYITYWYIASIILSILVYIASMVLYNSFNLHLDTDLYLAYNKLLASIPVWLFSILTTVACLLPDFVIRITKRGLKFSQSLLRLKRNKSESLSI